MWITQEYSHLNTGIHALIIYFNFDQFMSQLEIHLLIRRRLISNVLVTSFNFEKNENIVDIYDFYIHIVFISQVKKYKLG